MYVDRFRDVYDDGMFVYDERLIVVYVEGILVYVANYAPGLRS